MWEERFFHKYFPGNTLIKIGYPVTKLADHQWLWFFKTLVHADACKSVFPAPSMFIFLKAMHFLFCMVIFNHSTIMCSVFHKNGLEKILIFQTIKERKRTSKGIELHKHQQLKISLYEEPILN